MIVGYIKNRYPERRNIINAVPNVTYLKIRNYSRIFKNGLNKIKSFFLKKNNITTTGNRFYFNDYNLNNVNLIHLFNGISYGKTPWISTFETIIPRNTYTLNLHHGLERDFSVLKHNPEIIKALTKLAGNSCKTLIALSECNLLMQKEFLKCFPQYYEQIFKKLVCIHPPQKLYVKDWESKSISTKEPLRFMFVGGSFFRKGGMEILNVFLKLKKRKNFNFKLIIVSSLTIDNYATKETENDVNIAKDIINKNKDWIDYYKFLPNDKVMDLMKTSHIGLLPTYADTYGYSVLEFQACGCPVITTNVRALAEINSDDRGWVINVPKNRLGEAIYETKAQRDKISGVIKQNLINFIIDIMEHRQLIKQKGNLAIEYIRANHSPKLYSEKIREIYKEAITK